MAKLDSKQRNMVRKAHKSGVEVSLTEDPNDYQFLQTIHESNLADLGGRAKEARFFELARAHLATLTYIARFKGRPVAGAFLVRQGPTLEYFTPAILAEFRTYQPLSAIIFQAMLEAAQNGVQWWNWGGSWLSQESLITFKKRWGTLNQEYGYYIKLHQGIRPWLDMGKSLILKHYPYFYVIPFAELAA